MNSDKTEEKDGVQLSEMQSTVQNEDVNEADGGLAETQAKEDEKVPAKEKPESLKRFLQFLKFTLFSASAGAIQLLSTTLLHEWTGWLLDYYYIAYIIGLTLSVIWNFTFNRKFTFKAANNIPVAMVLVIIYNCLIVVPLAFGGDALVKIWGDEYGILVTAISLLINFVTEFFWDKFVVFNAKVTDKILRVFKKNKGTEEEAIPPEAADGNENNCNEDITK